MSDTENTRRPEFGGESLDWEDKLFLGGKYVTHILEEADGGSDGLLFLKVGFPRPAFLLLP